MVEIRIASRYRVLRAATIEFGNNSINCIVRDLSTTEAPLEVSNHIGIPAKFTLVVPRVDYICPAVLRGVAYTGSAWLSIRPPQLTSSFMYFDHSTTAA
jgi:hypothetical protein